MGELDELAKKAGQSDKKKGGDMKGAVEGTEAIREWVSFSFSVAFKRAWDQLLLGESFFFKLSNLDDLKSIGLARLSRF